MFVQGKHRWFCRCPSLEELVVTDSRLGYKSSNLGLWILTAMSTMMHLEKERHNISLQYAQLKSITLDINSPVLQTLNDKGEALVFLDEDLPKPWHDPYPLELQHLQVEHEIGLGGDVSCMSHEHMPALETLKVRAKSHNATFSTTTGYTLLQNVCKHRLLSMKRNNPSLPKCKRLVFYCTFADQYWVRDTSEKGRSLLQTFDKVEFKSCNDWPYF